MLLFALHLILLAICLMLKVLGIDYNLISILFAILSSIIVVVSISKMRSFSKQIKLLLIIAFMLRVILVVIDVYIVRLPETGFDDASFYRHSVEIYENNYADFSQEVYGGFFTKTLSLVYYFIGPSRLSAQYINVLFYAIAIILFAKALVNLNISHKASLVSLALLCFMPNAILHNSILRRETIIELFVCASIFYFSKWYRNGHVFDAFLAIIAIAIASLFHTALIAGAIVFSLYLLLYDKQKQSVSLSIKNWPKAFMVVALTVVTCLVFLSMFNNKFSSVDSMDDIYTAANRAKGGSVYLAGYEVSDVKELVLFAPLKLFYFLFSPVPWMFRNLMDIISFAFDALIYIALLIIVISSKKNSAARLMLTTFMIVAVVFALGTFNSGTAIRHRFSLLPFLLVSYALVKREKKNKKAIEDSVARIINERSSK